MNLYEPVAVPSVACVEKRAGAKLLGRALLATALLERLLRLLLLLLLRLVRTLAHEHNLDGRRVVNQTAARTATSR